MTDFSRNALVVEGGGMRGAFTSGVLDAFLQQRFNPFDLYVGVSSGSTNVANYLAGQQGRTALVVEGGGMRGAFTSGVLDAFLQQRFNPFDLYVGVSSGSTNVANYLTGQQGRTLTFYIDHSLRPEFIDYKRFFKGGDLLDLKWMW
ncbi:hypothetical protein CTY75_07420, partial [Acinetobacter baumannii]|nr:hypothetical protein [Acinetobacter baumannii]